MKHLRENKPIWHALAWVAMYVALVNVGDAVSSQGSGAVPVTGILLALLSGVLLVYLDRGELSGFYGLTRPRPGTMALALYLVPLIAIAFFQYAKGLSPELDVRSFMYASLFVAGVAFIEELLFRGFLFQALLKRGNLTRAILISGVTFGLGHVVNLARGYSLADQVVQVVAAVAIGIALAYCVALTGSIVPGVVFHALFNLSGTITDAGGAMDMVIVGAVLVVVVPYVFFLRGRLARTRGPLATAASADAAHAHGPA